MGGKALFLFFHVEAKIREKEKVKYFWVCVYVSCISFPFVCSWHPWLPEIKKKECLKRDPSKVFSVFLVVIKRANPLEFEQYKRS